MAKNNKKYQINTVHTEAKQMMDQIKAETPYEMEVKNFIELESKKYKKTDGFEDLINRG